MKSIDKKNNDYVITSDMLKDVNYDFTIADDIDDLFKNQLAIYFRVSIDTSYVNLQKILKFSYSLTGENERESELLTNYPISKDDESYIFSLNGFAYFLLPAFRTCAMIVDAGLKYEDINKNPDNDELLYFLEYIDNIEELNKDKVPDYKYAVLNKQQYTDLLNKFNTKAFIIPVHTDRTKIDKIRKYVNRSCIKYATNSNSVYRYNTLVCKIQDHNITNTDLVKYDDIKSSSGNIYQNLFQGLFKQEVFK